MRIVFFFLNAFQMFRHAYKHNFFVCYILMITNSLRQKKKLSRVIKNSSTKK